MTQERKQEIETEVKRRLNLWLENSTFEEMTVNGSKMRFETALGMVGYPFVPESWMSKKDCSQFIKDYEFYSQEYNDIIDELFKEVIE
jgi:hypothetical protein